MKRTILLSMVALISACVVYYSACKRAAKIIVHFERDTPDAMSSAQQASVKAGYDPYFTRVNVIPDNTW